MSEITPTNSRLPSTVNDPNTAQNRGQPAPLANSSAVPLAAASPVDTVELSAAAQASTARQGNGTVLTDTEAQNTASGLRQSIGQQGLSASARQNAAILALIRP